MYAILTSAFSWLVRTVLGQSIVKWAFAAVLWFGLTIFIDMLVDLLPVWFSSSSLNAGTSAFTPGMWYFIDYFMITEGLSSIFAAYSVRFLIRRIPFIG